MDKENEIFSILNSTHEQRHFGGWENTLATVISLRVLGKCCSHRNKLSNVESLVILRPGEGVTFKKDNHVNPLSASVHIQILQTDLHTFP